MKKKRKEKKKIWVILIITTYLIAFYLGVITEEFGEKEEIKDNLIDTCHVGCIYSTKFYYNNSNFEKELYDCMLYCTIEISALDYFKK